MGCHASRAKSPDFETFALIFCNADNLLIGLEPQGLVGGAFYGFEVERYQ